MINRKQQFSRGLILVLTLTGVAGCSVMSKVGKTARNLTTFGGNKHKVAVDDTLIIPPSLKIPVDNGNPVARQAQPKPRIAKTTKVAYSPTKNYYIIVGTYPEQVDALDTFVRLSSIGLKGATMESRVTKGGKSLHMVRLGPFSKQEDIDKAKDSLTSDGLSQFKVVEN